MEGVRLAREVPWVVRLDVSGGPVYKYRQQHLSQQDDSPILLPGAPIRWELTSEARNISARVVLSPIHPYTRCMTSLGRLFLRLSRSWSLPRSQARRSQVGQRRTGARPSRLAPV